jgi:hypothetical protein
MEAFVPLDASYRELNSKITVAALGRFHIFFEPK